MCIRDREVTAVCALLVRATGVEGHTSSRTGVQRGLLAAAAVHQLVAGGFEPAATAEREQRQVVEEAQPQAAQQHRLSGRDAVQVGVGGIAGRNIGQTVDPGQARGAFLLRRRPGGHMSLGQDDGVQTVQPRTVRQADPLRSAGTAVGVGHGHGTRGVHPDLDMAGRAGQDTAEALGEVPPAQGAGRVGVRPQRPCLRQRGGVVHRAGGPAPRPGPGQRRGPLVQARPRFDRPADPGRRVGVDGDLRGDRVGQQEPRLVGAPHGTRAGRGGVHHVDEHPCVRRPRTLVRAQSFQHRESPRTRADDRDLVRSRVQSEHPFSTPDRHGARERRGRRGNGPSLCGRAHSDPWTPGAASATTTPTIRQVRRRIGADRGRS